MTDLARLLLAAISCALWLSAPAIAVPLTVTHSDLSSCDPLFVPAAVDELGDAAFFPADELIVATDTFTATAACPTDTSAPNALVTMTNLTTTDFVEVWYVADHPDTALTNADGTVDGGRAFRIDAVGINTPLVFESLAANGIFEAGETWDFIIDDYFNVLGIGADAFFSAGAVGVFSGGPPSSGSIIAIPIPEPATALLVGLGLLALSRRR